MICEECLTKEGIYMIDYIALMQHLPFLLTVITILSLLIGVPYQLEKALFKAEGGDDE